MPTPTVQRDEPLTPTHHHLIEPHMVPHLQCGYGTRGLVNYHAEVLLAEPGGRRFTQPLFVVEKCTKPRVQPIDGSGAPNKDPFVMDFDPEFNQPQSPGRLHIQEVKSIPADKLKARQKKEHQWAKWANNIIPSMVVPYLQYLFVTQLLRDLLPDSYEHQNCNCGNEGFLTVTCVYFEHKLFYLPLRRC